MQRVILIESSEMMKERIMHTYSVFFLSRLKCEKEKDFLDFYTEQIKKYFKLKKNTYMSLMEGDMVTDLILSVYLDIVSSPFITNEKCRKRILENAKIIFPLCQSDTEEEYFTFSVSL